MGRVVSVQHDLVGPTVWGGGFVGRAVQSQVLMCERTMFDGG
jgi:hypothetical protein